MSIYFDIEIVILFSKLTKSTTIDKDEIMRIELYIFRSCQ